ncbi:MAG: CpaE family protein [Paracoccaceae bacterium]
MSSAMPQHEASTIVACTVSRDVQNFDLLIEDMEAELGAAWGDLGFAEAIAFFSQPDAEALEFIALAIDSEDESELDILSEVVRHARARNIAVVLIAEDVTPSTLHSLMRQSDGEFVPYPLPENELHEAIVRSRKKTQEPVSNNASQGKQLHGGQDRQGAVFAVHGLAGGVGATTLATNLAWELANSVQENGQSVCLLDLDFQFGTASTYLDLARREVVLEMLSETETMDDDIFGQALVEYDGNLSVLTAPADMIPLDMITTEDMERVIKMARSHFDYVVLDMPSTLVQWTETVLHEAHVYFCVMELDMRCAQNTLRFKRALQSEDLPIEKLRYVLNRAPKFTDLSGKSRVKRLSDSLDISLDINLPEGGRYVLQSGDHGQPLALSAPKNPLRKEITKLAQQIHELQHSSAEAA